MFFLHQKEFMHHFLEPGILFKEKIEEQLREDSSFWSLPLNRLWFSGLDMFHRWTKKHEHPSFDIKDIEVHGNKYHVCQESVLLSKPFCYLRKFEKENAPKNEPALLIVAPLSGHYATLLRDTISTALQDHTVYVTDWISASEVPLSEGDFGLDTYIDYLIEFLDVIPSNNIHILAVCQPCVPVLMAVNYMEQEKYTKCPKSMILMGGPIDITSHPTTINAFSSSHSMQWFKDFFVHKVPLSRKGAGRKVIPGHLILNGFIANNIPSHFQKHIDYLFACMNNEKEAQKRHREFYDEYLSVLDLPARYFLETIDLIFHQNALFHNKTSHRGKKLDLKNIQNVALMTIEGDHDDITGLGQTSIAHKLCTHIPKDKQKELLVLGVGHYGLFSGHHWRNETYKDMTDFIKKNS